MIRAQAEETPTAVTPTAVAVAGPQGRPLNPTQLATPAFLLAVPFSLSTEVANNPWMEDLPSDRRGPDARKAMRQWLDLYHFVATEAVVYLLPSLVRVDDVLDDELRSGHRIDVKLVVRGLSSDHVNDPSQTLEGSNCSPLPASLFSER